jgi:hypothetical protein
VVRRVQRRSQCIREHRNWRILVSKKQGVSRGRTKCSKKGVSCDKIMQRYLCITRELKRWYKTPSSITTTQSQPPLTHRKTPPRTKISRRIKQKAINLHIVPVLPIPNDKISIGTTLLHPLRLMFVCA